MDRRGEESGARHSSIRQVALAGFVGTTMEWYDFFLYGAATALIFNQLYFPSVDPLARDARGLLHVRGRLHRPSFGRHNLRTLRRQDRPQAEPHRNAR